MTATIAVTVLLGVLLLLILGSLYQAIASRRDARKYPPPGRLVRAPHGGVVLHLDCQGEGPVAVILEAGQGDCSLDWTRVQSTAATLTRVCAYDRPGLGWSSPSSRMLTAQQTAENLHYALEGAGIAGPYVLVGHSIGGVYARAFAQQYRGEVVGLVLVDSAHENQRLRLPEEALGEEKATRRLASMLRVLTPVGIPRALKLADRMQGESFAINVRPAAMARLYQSHFPKALSREVKAAEFNTAQREAPADLGDTALIVLSRGATNPGIPEAQFARLRQAWSELQRELVALSTHSKHVVADESGHYIHHDQPEVVTDAIREVVEAAQGRRTL